MLEKKDEYILGCRKLIQLMEKDSEEIAFGLQGDLLTAYRNLLSAEKDILTRSLRDYQNK